MEHFQHFADHHGHAIVGSYDAGQCTVRSKRSAGHRQFQAGRQIDHPGENHRTNFWRTENKKRLRGHLVFLEEVQK